MIDTETSLQDAIDQDKAKKICEVLEKHYPGYMWVAQVDSPNGIANFWSPAVSGIHGYTMHLKEWGPDNKEIINGGGQILERHRLVRGQMQEDQVCNLKRDLRGNVIGNHD